MKSKFLDIRFASKAWEFHEVHKLNYKTFVEEIPQHTPNPDGVLVDQFHSENKYLIAMRGTELLGMLTFRDKRPFSLDKKLSDLDAYLPPSRAICEIRLLAFKSEYRHTVLFWLIFERLIHYWEENDYDLMIMSGTIRQLKLYEYLGFKHFGSPIGDKKAMFQPMFWTKESLRNSIAYKELSKQLSRSNAPVTLLPDSAGVSTNTRGALTASVLYRQSKEDIKDANIGDLSAWVTINLQALGFDVLGNEGNTLTEIVTIALPEEINSQILGRKLEKKGFYLGYDSNYLVKQNLIQIGLLRNISKEEIIPLFRELLLQIATY